MIKIIYYFDMEVRNMIKEQAVYIILESNGLNALAGFTKQKEYVDEFIMFRGGYEFFIVKKIKMNRPNLQRLLEDYMDYQILEEDEMYFGLKLTKKEKTQIYDILYLYAYYEIPKLAKLINRIPFADDVVYNLNAASNLSDILYDPLVPYYCTEQLISHVMYLKYQKGAIKCLSAKKEISYL